MNQPGRCSRDSSLWSPIGLGSALGEVNVLPEQVLKFVLRPQSAEQSNRAKRCRVRSPDMAFLNSSSQSESE